MRVCERERGSTCVCTCVCMCVCARGHVCQVNFHELIFNFQFSIFTKRDSPPTHIDTDGWNAGRRVIGADEACAYAEDLAERDSDEHNYEADEDFGAIDRKSNISIVH